MTLLMLAAAGGAIGATTRLLVYSWLAPSPGAGSSLSFPWATLAVNVCGGFFMGFVVVLLLERLGNSMEWRAFLATGVLGGFTTFSAFSLDMFNLIEADGPFSPRLLIYVLASVAGAFGALIAGLWVGRALLS